jgi:CheY-like chemotaxis protein
VAHDFNNILQVISGHTELIIEDAPKDSAIQEDLKQVSKAANRATSLVRQLLSFSRRESLKLDYINLNDLINNLLKMVGRIIGEHIELNYKPGAKPGTIHADSGQIEQIIINLCVNARDAMPEGGRLIIETGNIEFEKEYCLRYPEAKPGRYVMLLVADTGPGIPTDIKSRVFEPFFTTKGVGEGTGLGLSTVYAITKRHDGFLNLYSEEGIGAIFKVYLPLAEDATESTKKQQYAKIENIQGNGETILVAEDDKQVRSLAVSILEKAGYSVLTASDGEEAINVFKQHIEEIDLALLDVVMPKKNGLMVYQFIRSYEPSLPILFASGYNLDVLDAEHLPEGTFNIIYKPYDKNDLLTTIKNDLKSPK